MRFLTSIALAAVLGAAVPAAAQTSGATASAAYEAALAAATLDHVKAEALLGVARSSRAAGQKDKAVTALRQVLEKYKETAAFPVAEVRLAEIAASNQ